MTSGCTHQVPLRDTSVLPDSAPLFPSPSARSAPATELQSSRLPRGARPPTPTSGASGPSPPTPFSGSAPAPAEQRVSEAVRQCGRGCFPNHVCPASPSSLPPCRGLLGLPVSQAEPAAAPGGHLSSTVMPVRPPIHPSVHPFLHLSVCSLIHPPLRPLALQALTCAFCVPGCWWRHQRCTGEIFSRSQSSLLSQVSPLRLDLRG